MEDWEYWLVYKVALHSSYSWAAPMMEFAYLCRMRASEVRALTKDHLLKDGVFVERGKGSKNEITTYSPRLRRALNLAQQFTKSDSYLFSTSGGQIPKTSFDTAFRRARQTSMLEGILFLNSKLELTLSYNFHDIKAKGITDHSSKEGGHRTRKMAMIYDRKPKLIVRTR